MANLQPNESSSTADVSGGSSESTFQLNVKTLDSRIYSFHVDKNITVSAFKEKIASQSGVPVGQQRLIFRGKVLKDDHLISEYSKFSNLCHLCDVYLKNIIDVENGDTLHLVERQPQPSPGPNTGEATSSNGGIGGQDSTGGASRPRIGQIGHSIVLGTLNVGDPGEAVVPDLSGVIGAVLNSVGFGNLARGMQPGGIGNLAGGMQPGVQTSHGNETEGSQVNAGSQSQSQGGNQSVPWQAFHGQSASHTMQNPLGAPIIPSLNTPIPDSLNTLSEFMNRMELAFSQSGTQQNESSTASGDLPAIELPRDSRGLSTPEALTIILRHAQRLLSDHAVLALSHTASRLDEEGGSNDPVVRGQVQTQSVQLGVAMQHLGALFLELGRTILTLRMGQSSGESFVNAGPAVYISPSGPNPIMVQPFPLQTSSLFGGSSNAAPNPVAMGPLAVGSIPRNVNIHIHTGASSLAPIIPTVAGRGANGEGMQDEGVNVTESGGPGQPRVLSGLNVNATAVPSRPTMILTSGGVPADSGVSQASGSDSVSAMVAEINSHLRRTLSTNAQNQSHAPSEGSADQEQPGHCGAREDDTSGEQSNLPSSRVGETGQTLPYNEPSTSSKGGTHNGSITSERAENFEGPSRSSQGKDNPDGSSGVPLGLGLGGLQPKRRGKQPKAQTKNSESANSSGQNQTTRAVGQTLQNADGHIDAADAMSEMLQSPSLDGLLAGVSQQTGVGSPDMLRTMLQQFTQNPAMRNTVNQMAQQIDHHDLGSMFSGMDRGQGGGIDLSRMMQQMMPIVSQALGGMSSVSQLSTPSGPVLSDSSSRRDVTQCTDDSQQIDIQEVVQRLENQSPPEEIFRSMVDRAVHVLHISSGGSAAETVVNELCSQGSLAQEFVEMLRRDISRRLQDEM
ncbi:hypothetical protein BUALT_Bualt01G0020100 [Buddleja alternifolia]|uniref:Ubiquitin-like domain-containing protein n=1 Tax=Buddleja alternifolia TaxID=168488 RepID=A0AAV6Y559_9LAMI|nr:hypothetical protein BUALT_Bualt01G0020100 [Buddleja alternifolia]